MDTPAQQKNAPSFSLFKQEPISTVTAKALDDLSQTDTSEVQKIASNQIKLLAEFYDQSLSQAHRSFAWALVASIVGLVFFMVAIAFQVLNNGEVAQISLIGGALIEFIAAVNFYLYGEATNQLNTFHARLEVTQRFLLGNSLCESLGEDYKDEARAKLISQLVGGDDHELVAKKGSGRNGRRRRHERESDAGEDHPAAANAG